MSEEMFLVILLYAFAIAMTILFIMLIIYAIAQHKKHKHEE